MSINLGSVTIPPEFFGNEPAYRSLTYVYALHVDCKVFYVGTSVDPVSRYFTHMAGRTKDNQDLIAKYKAEGKEIVMHLIDLTDREHRYFWEGFYIRELGQRHELCNTKKYYKETAEVIACPTCYRSLSRGTLKPIN